MHRRSTTSKAIVVLLAAIVVLLVRGTRRQRRLVRLLTGFSLLNPIGDAVSWIAGGFSSVGGDVKDFVIRAMDAVGTVLQAGIDTVTRFAESVMSAAIGFFNAAIGFAQAVGSWAVAVAQGLYWSAVNLAQSIGQWAVAIAQGLYSTAVQFAQSVGSWAVAVAQGLAQWAVGIAQGLVTAAIGFLQGLVSGAIQLAQTLVGGAINLLQGLVSGAIQLAQQLFTTVLHFAQTAVADAVRMLQGFVAAAIDDLRGFLSTVIDTVGSGLSSAVGDVQRYVYGPLEAIASVIGDVIDWLQGLAAFPFSMARDLWSAMRSTGGGTILAGSPGFVDRWGAHIAGHNTQYASDKVRSYTLPPLPGFVGGDVSNPGGGAGSAPGHGTPDRAAFATALLARLGAPVTDTNMAFLLAWMGREGTNATFNPLATTLDYQPNTRFNSVGVRNYPDIGTGVAATAATLTGGGYASIVADLRRGDGRAAGQEHAELARWSGGGYSTVSV